MEGKFGFSRVQIEETGDMLAQTFLRMKNIHTLKTLFLLSLISLDTVPLWLHSPDGRGGGRILFLIKAKSS